VDDRLERVQHFFEIPALVAAALVIPDLLIEGSNLSGGWDTATAILNWAIWLVFAVELVALLAVATHRGRWLVRHPLEVAIVLLTPPFLPAALQSARALRLLRLLRLFRLAPLARRVFSADGVRFGGVLALVAALGGGAAFAAFEQHQTTLNGVYWAITTMTTVGYGDPSPHTAGAKLVAVLLMTTGIGIIALVTGAIAERFVRPTVQRDVELAEEQIAAEVGLAEGDVARELREIMDRLARVEAAISRQRRQR
jgi:voltage-gated potassium channel